MASKYITSSGENTRIEYGYTCTGTVTGDVLILPKDLKELSIQLSPVGGTAYVDVSLDGTHWLKWDTGDVASGATAGEILGAVNYLRVTNNTATSSSLYIIGTR
jgi:hypothetical protein